MKLVLYWLVRCFGRALPGSYDALDGSLAMFFVSLWMDGESLPLAEQDELPSRNDCLK